MIVVVVVVATALSLPPSSSPEDESNVKSIKLLPLLFMLPLSKCNEKIYT
jgi:hypothetical protein